MPPADVERPDDVEDVDVVRLAHGGEAVGRLGDGRAVFVAGAVPGERVRVAVTQARRRWARAHLLAVLEASPDRTDPPCPYFGPTGGPQRPGGCGGCQLQHIAPDRRASLVRRVVIDQLQRIGGVAEPSVADTVIPAEYGYRSRARFSVDADGRLGFRGHRSHAVRPIDRCLLLDDATQHARDEAGDAWAGAAQVEVRTGADGRAALTVLPTDTGLTALPPRPEAVALVGAAGRAQALRGDPVLVEHVAGHDFRVSPDSFFQANRAGAAVLVELVLAGAAVGSGDTVVDLYAGVGLLTRALATSGARITAVEAGAAAAADAATNLAGIAEVVRARAERWLAGAAARGERVDVAMLDPPRRGAGAAAAAELARVARRTIVYVACDPAALARDTAALLASGWRLAEAVPVDQFAQTAQIEVVATFRRG